MDMLGFGDYVVFASGERMVEKLGKEFFLSWQNEKVQRGIVSKGVIGEKYRGSFTVNNSSTTWKYLPSYENIGLTFVFKDKVAIIILSDEPVAFLINSKDVAENNRNYFELLWNQEIHFMRGIDGVHEAWNEMLDELKPGEEYYVLGTSWHGKTGEIDPFFIDFHKRRIEKGIGARFLFVSGTENLVRKNTESYYTNASVKFLPRGIYEGMQFNLYKNKVLLFVWREKEPIVFKIDDKTMYLTFKTYFDTLWQQETRVVSGLDAIQSIFEELLYAGEADFIAASGYFINARPEYTKEWEKRAKEKGLKIRVLLDPESKGKGMDRFSFSEAKYTIPKEFSKLSVFWIFSGKVVIANWTEKEPLAVIIENKYLYDMYKQQFEMLWNKDTFVSNEVGMDGVEILLKYA
jgi:hypothetical protein